MSLALQCVYSSDAWTVLGFPTTRKPLNQQKKLFTAGVCSDARSPTVARPSAKRTRRGRSATSLVSESPISPLNVGSQKRLDCVCWEPGLCGDLSNSSMARRATFRTSSGFGCARPPDILTLEIGACHLRANE